MPRKGPPPNEQRSRTNDTTRRHAEYTHVDADGQARGPELPNAQAWHPRTRAWWQTWRESAQAQTFTATDWDFLLDTALLHHAMWTDAETKNAAEIRLRLSRFGSTPEDRQRLRLKVDTPPPEEEPEPDSDEKAETVSRREGLRIVG